MKKNKKYVVNEFIDESFGFKVLLKNVVMYDDEQFGPVPLINYNVLKVFVMEKIIGSSIKLTGAKFEFLRRCQNKSLRDMAQLLDVSHTEVKNWELKKDEFTGMSDSQERLFRAECVDYLQREKEEEFNKFIFSATFKLEDDILEIGKEEMVV